MLPCMDHSRLPDTRMETPPLTRKPAPSTSRELVISRRWINSQGKWIALLLDFLIIPVMIVRVLELSGSLTSPLNATLLIPIGVMVWQFSSPRVHVNAQARPALPPAPTGAAAAHRSDSWAASAAASEHRSGMPADRAR